jgi:hypothetical protein
VWQPPALCEMLTDPPFNTMDHNLYISQSTHYHGPLILWSPAKNQACQEQLSGPDAVHMLHPELSASSVYDEGYTSDLFQGRETGDFRLMKDFKGHSVAGSVPDPIRNLMGVERGIPPFIGAFPVLK